MEDRFYQSDAIIATCRGFVEFDKQLVVIPTGGGKTIIFSKLAHRFHVKRNERTLILAHREELINQAAAKCYATSGLQTDIEKAELWAGFDAPVVVASIPTLQNGRLERWPRDHFGLVVADEAHHSLADQWMNVLRYFERAKQLGVTATPDRGDKRLLSSYYENVAYEITILELINAGYLAPVTIQAIPLEIDISTVRAVAGDLRDGDLGDALLPYLKTIAKTIATVCKGRKILAFLPLIETSKKFVEECQAAGINARHVDGDSKNRDAILADFGAGEFELLSNAMLLTEGYDEPSIDCVLMLRPTKSRALYAQAIGRGTRLYPGKKDLLVLDFLWLHAQHNLARPASLIASTPEQEASITAQIAEAGTIDLLEAEKLAEEQRESDAAAEREAALARALADAKKHKARLMSLEEVAIMLQDRKMREYSPVFRWEGAPATPKQKELLARFGITATSRGEAGMLMDRMFDRSKRKLATVKQLMWLIRLKHPNPHEATAKEAKEFLDAKWGKRVK